MTGPALCAKTSEAVGLGQSQSQTHTSPGGAMTRFPNYQPSPALREAIEALRHARQKDRAAAEAVEPGQSGGPGALTQTPGREDTGTGAAEGQGCGREGHPDLSDTDALTSGRDDDA